VRGRLALGGLWLSACAGVAAPAARLPGPARPVSAAEPATDALLTDDTLETAERLRGEGFAREAERIAGFLPPSAHEAVRVSIPARRCVAFAGRASAGMHDLDGALYLPDGTLLAEDEGADAEPLVTYCADEAIPVAYLVLRAYRGAGAYAVSEWTRGVRFGDPVLTPAELREGSLRELTVALVRRGFHPEGPVREVRPQADAALIVPLSVQPFSCYSVMASTLEGEVSLRLLDGEAHEVAHGASDPHVSAAQRCVGQSASDWSIELRGQGGAKAVRLWVYSAREREVGGERALWLGEPGPSALAAGARRLTHALAQGQVAEVPLPPLAAPCAQLHVALVPGLAKAQVRVEDRAGHALAESQVGPSGAALHYCAGGGVVAVLSGAAGFGALTLDVAPSAP